MFEGVAGHGNALVERKGASLSIYWRDYQASGWDGENMPAN